MRDFIGEATPLLTLERLRSLITYEPDTGSFRWVVTNRTVRAGTIAGCADKDGYRRIRIDGRQYKAHRLAFLYAYGEWPPEFIDHINGDPGDNRLANLRLATNGQNQANAKRNRVNRSGFKGVCFDAAARRWEVRITSNGKRRYLGRFPTPEEAHRVYVNAAREAFGEFARAS